MSENDEMMPETITVKGGAPMSEECAVITGLDPDAFTGRINTFLADGWRLVGPVTAAQHIDAMWLVATLLRDRDDER